MIFNDLAEGNFTQFLENHKVGTAQYNFSHTQDTSTCEYFLSGADIIIATLLDSPLYRRVHSGISMWLT